MHQRITQLIKNRNLSTPYIAKKVNVSESTIRNFKAGRNESSLDFIKFLFLEFPELNPLWLFFGKGEMWILKENSDISLNDISTQKELANEVVQLKKDMELMKSQIAEISKDFEGVDIKVMIEIVKRMIEKEKQ